MLGIFSSCFEWLTVKFGREVVQNHVGLGHAGASLDGEPSLLRAKCRLFEGNLQTGTVQSVKRMVGCADRKRGRKKTSGLDARQRRIRSSYGPDICRRRQTSSAGAPVGESGYSRSAFPSETRQSTKTFNHVAMDVCSAVQIIILLVSPLHPWGSWRVWRQKTWAPTKPGQQTFPPENHKKANNETVKLSRSLMSRKKEWNNS